MNTTHKKRKKKWSRESNPTGSESEVISREDSVPAVEQGIKQKNRQVTSKSGYEKDTKVKNAISEYLAIIVQFLRDSKIELKKVKWPTRKELLAATSMVILLSIAIALFLGLIDFALTGIITKIIG
jgi:preprotein translocase subunit SecE